MLTKLQFLWRKTDARKVGSLCRLLMLTVKYKNFNLETLSCLTDDSYPDEGLRRPKLVNSSHTLITALNVKMSAL